jgi:hypothetical protein
MLYLDYKNHIVREPCCIRHQQIQNAQNQMVKNVLSMLPDNTHQLDA